MSVSFRSTLALTALTASLFCPLTAHSNDADSLSKFMACAEIENPPLRYACFDKTAAAVKARQEQGLDTAEPGSVPSRSLSTESQSPGASANGSITAGATSDIAAPETEENAEDEKRGLFGFIGGLTKKPTTPEEFGLEDEPDEADVITEISGNISDFRITGTGRVIVLLDNGQIWQQIPGDSTRLREQIMERQTSATIETAAMGTYLMSLSPSGRSIRVKRIQ